MQAVLHGINDVVAGGSLWVGVTVLSALLFLAYARIGIDESATDHTEATDPPTGPIPTESAPPDG